MQQPFNYSFLILLIIFLGLGIPVLLWERRKKTDLIKAEKESKHLDAVSAYRYNAIVDTVSTGAVLNASAHEYLRYKSRQPAGIVFRTHSRVLHDRKTIIIFMDYPRRTRRHL